VTPSPFDRTNPSVAELQAQRLADAHAEAYLLYRDGDGAQRIVELAASRDRITVGRSHAADVPLPWDPRASRVHAALERLVDGWTLVDDRLSRNGSFVNDERSSGRRRLAHGDKLRFGMTVIEFRAPRPAATTETLPALDLPAWSKPSPAQRRVLVALCRPFVERPAFATPPTNHEIADELVLSIDAIKTHVRALYRHFGVDALPRSQKRAELVRRALDSGQVSAHDYVLNDSWISS
jgi:hypothetical protein